MGHVKGAFESTSIRILPFAIENLSVQVNVIGVDSAVESDGNHLGDLSGVNVSGDSGAIGRTETVGQLTLAQVTVGSCVGILLDCASTLVGAVRTVVSFVAEKFLINALSIAALQLIIRTDWFVGLEVRESSPWF